MPIPGISCMGVSGASSSTFSVEYLGTDSNSASSTHTFSSVAFGDADTNRVILVGFAVDNNTDTVSSVTIGGVSATRLVRKTADGTCSYIWGAPVPTGTTGDIVISLSFSRAVRIGWFRMIRSGASITPTNTGSTSVTSGDISLFCTVPTNGAGIVIVGDNDTGNHTATNYTESFDGSDGAFSDSCTGGIFTTSATLTCSNAASNGNDKALVYASWGP